MCELQQSRSIKLSWNLHFFFILLACQCSMEMEWFQKAIAIRYVYERCRVGRRSLTHMHQQSRELATLRAMRRCTILLFLLICYCYFCYCYLLLIEENYKQNLHIRPNFARFFRSWRARVASKRVQGSFTICHSHHSECVRALNFVFHTKFDTDSLIHFLE